MSIFAAQLAAPPVVELDLDLVEVVLRLELELDDAVLQLTAERLPTRG